MVLREADVVRCTSGDFAALGVDMATVRAALRPAAVLVSGSGAGDAWAIGPFGEVVEAPRARGVLRPAGAGDVFTAAICAELARAGEPGEGSIELWRRALQRGQAASARGTTRG